MTGWLCATGWQCGVVAVAFIAGTIIQGLIVLNDATYVYARWQGTLLIIAITTFSVLFNTFLAKKLPLIEILLLILHVVGLFLVIIPLWVVSPLNSAESVFTNFGNAGGWNSYGTATIVGFSTSIAGLSGYDCAVHMCKFVPSKLHFERLPLIGRMFSRRNQRRFKNPSQGYDNCFPSR
jgi:hypothetical protein